MGKTLTTDADETLVLRNVTWGFYEMFTSAIGERPSRVSFDGQTLEMVMTLSFEHERLSAFFAAVVREIARATRTRIVEGGSTTLRLKKGKRGLEPDQCYWVRHADAVRDAKQIDMSKHPAPDLVIEIDVTHASVNRDAIYAGLGVAEMWHYARSTGVTGWIRRGTDWERSTTSVSFPGVRLSEINKLVARFVQGEDEIDLLDELRGLIERKDQKRR